MTTTTVRTPLVVETFALSCGNESVGLPPACSTETLVRQYLELLARVRSEPVVRDVRDEDLVTLAAARGIDLEALRHRVESAQG